MSMWLDGQCGVYFYDKTQPDKVYSYDRYTGEKYKATIILSQDKIIEHVGKDCYRKYHHEYLLTDLEPVKHLPREFMNYIQKRSRNVPKDYIYALGY